MACSFQCQKNQAYNGVIDGEMVLLMQKWLEILLRKQYFIMLEQHFSSKLDGNSFIISNFETASNKTGSSVLQKFLSP